jgi:hypothetical protein
MRNKMASASKMACCALPQNGVMTVTELIAAYRARVQRLEEARQNAHGVAYGDKLAVAYEEASTDRLEALFALFRFEPRTRADAEALLRFIGDDPDSFETWRSIADDDEHATFRGALAKAMLSAPERDFDR